MSSISSFSPFPSMGSRLVIVLVATCCAITTWARTSDWPQWRGPRRDGVATDSRGPGAWPAKLTKIWSVPVGEGHSNPVVAGDRVYLHSREADQEVVRALRL